MANIDIDIASLKSDLAKLDKAVEDFKSKSDGFLNGISGKLDDHRSDFGDSIKKTMDTNKNKLDEILYHAHRCMYFNEKTIEQCGSWLSAEEGNENMMQSIRERAKIQSQQSVIKKSINNHFMFNKLNSK